MQPETLSACLKTKEPPNLCTHPSVLSYPLPYSWCLSLTHGLKSILGSGWKQSSLYSTPHPISIPPSDPPYTKKYSKQNKRIIVLLIIILLSIVYIYEWRKLNTFTFRVCELLLSRKTNGDLKRFQPIVVGSEGGGRGMTNLLRKQQFFSAMFCYHIERREN